ncbi:phosphatidylglycerophosphatase A family protein [Poseidonibacter antarcticus]|uniref:phosphatidylglycerophosphatase A family protein n=1 Tax=Poseidonibacter antarcticus TaxID=2478538 RepID=UPI000EF4DF90|nr:phosphatidylglycerophosphatase A [Poseidonibacter antarcticus]
MNLRKFFLTVGFSGLSPKAPGTVGSFVSLLLILPLIPFLHVSTIFMLAILITVLAVKQIDIYEDEVGVHDGKEIVIDELAGMWIAISICGITSENMIILAPIAFLYFRLFDIWKPSIIGRIDREVKGGWGVMGDDIVAGIAAGVATAGTYEVLKMFVL